MVRTRAGKSSTIRGLMTLRSFLGTLMKAGNSCRRQEDRPAVGSYLRPAELREALAALAAGPRIILAGGTDYYPARVGQPLDDDLLDITALPALRRIADDGA